MHRRGTLGQYLADAIHEQLAAIQFMHPGIEIKLKWTLGHEGIMGNEQADEEAKQVARGKSSAQQELHKLCRQDLPLS